MNESARKLAARAMWKIKHKCRTGGIKGQLYAVFFALRSADRHNVTRYVEVAVLGAEVCGRRNMHAQCRMVLCLSHEGNPR